jgi:succinate dehydrogenase/fumarate reductase flavoprotein subunit
MHISEIGLCSGHSASGVWVNERGETSVPGLYAAGDMACVPHNYLLGALTYGQICANHAARYIADVALSELPADAVDAERQRLLAPLDRPRGLPPQQYEYKVRRMVNDYLQPPKTETRMQLGLSQFVRAEQELEELGATNPHELMRVMECHFIRDCAEMAARASLYRTESRWGLYHYRLDYPELDNENWFCHVNLQKNAAGAMTAFKRPIEPYLIPLAAGELSSYQHIRVGSAEAVRAQASP